MASSRRSSRRRSSASRSPRRRSSLLSRISYEALARTVSNYPARRRRAGPFRQVRHPLRCPSQRHQTSATISQLVGTARQSSSGTAACTIICRSLTSRLVSFEAPSSGTLRAFWDGQVASGCRLTMMARQSAAPRHICQPDDRLAPDSFGEPGKT
uniref:Uncharacterized protein n=1 Tax=Plectus sambesii TaxID=2011161 RepID=A0A914WC56_9BILA